MSNATNTQAGGPASFPHGSQHPGAPTPGQTTTLPPGLNPGAPRTPPGTTRNRSQSLSVQASPTKGNGGPARKKAGVDNGDGKPTGEVTKTGNEGYKDSSQKETPESTGMQGVEPRNTKNLPKPASKKPFTLPDLATVPPDPATVRLSPSRSLMKPQPRPATSTESFTQPLPGPFRILRPTPKWLMQNVASEHMVKIINDPHKFLAVVLFGAGARLYEKHDTFTDLALEWINSLGLSTNVSLHLVAAKDTVKPRENPFQPPLICALSKFTTELRDYLTSHQTFIISPNLAFHVLPFDPNAAPWMVTRLQGTMVKDNPGNTQQARAALVQCLFAEPSYRKFVIDQAKNSRGHLSDDEIVYTSISSIELHYVHDTDNQGGKSPYYLVTSLPHFYHEKPDVHREWVGLIEGIKFYSCPETLARYFPFKKPFKMCNLCKFDDCHEDNCHITKMEGYDGPRLSGFQQEPAEETTELPPSFADLIPEPSNRGSYRGWNGGRRGYRGAPSGHRGASQGYRGALQGFRGSSYGHTGGTRGQGRGRGNHTHLYYQS
ncbi:hypothetical protein AAF712_013561 [Marasmius tenuissimus]|uniref:Uncharacterized protein n=1 Tax=Marasmius tenuissimus TaxID=585030 RepID=A0ABR2ZFV9_9AGAR